VIGDREYELTSEEAGEIASLLIELDYSKDKICRCVPDYTFRIYPGYRKLPSSLEDSANSGPEIAFGVKISEDESYSRCVAGQESLDAAVSAKLAAIIENAKNR